jgi:hypothetical protein
MDDLAKLVGVARQQAWRVPDGAQLTYASLPVGGSPASVASSAAPSAMRGPPLRRPPPVLDSYVGAAVTLDTSAQANFTDHEYQKNWQTRNYERASIEAMNSGQAHVSAMRFMQRFGTGVPPRVRALHDRIAMGRSMERTQNIMQDEPTYYAFDGTDPTMAMWGASQAALDAWGSGLPVRDARAAGPAPALGEHDDSGEYATFQPAATTLREARGPWW